MVDRAPTTIEVRLTHSTLLSAVSEYGIIRIDCTKSQRVVDGGGENTNLSSTKQQKGSNHNNIKNQPRHTLPVRNTNATPRE